MKAARDCLLVVGVTVDDEELLCIVLKGLPKEYTHFCSAIRTCTHFCSCYSDAYKFHIQDIPMGKILYQGLSENGVYPIYSRPLASRNHFTSPLFNSKSNSSAHFKTAQQQHYENVVNRHSSNKWTLWHQKLGHPSDKCLMQHYPFFQI